MRQSREISITSVGACSMLPPHTVTAQKRDAALHYGQSCFGDLENDRDAKTVAVVI
jgi:hypothetical protein